MTKELDAKHIFQMTNIFTTYFYCGGGRILKIHTQLKSDYLKSSSAFLNNYTQYLICKNQFKIKNVFIFIIYLFLTTHFQNLRSVGSFSSFEHLLLRCMWTILNQTI